MSTYLFSKSKTGAFFMLSHCIQHFTPALYNYFSGLTLPQLYAYGIIIIHMYEILVCKVHIKYLNYIR